MNPPRLLEYFDRIAEAPDAVNRLRQFILNLAVRGKLVEQDPNDEPASELLNRIETKKTLLVKGAEIKKQPELAPVSTDEEPFEIPDTWIWVHFGAIADFSAGRTPPRHDSILWNTGDYPWCSIADIQDGETLTATKETVSKKAKNQTFKSDPVPVGTIIMSFKLTIGKIARLGISAFHNEAIISIRPHINEIDEYLFLVLPHFSRQGKTKAAIKGATLNRESITNILVPLPPLAEQQRIGARFDELIALCDQLEEAQNERESRRDRLVAASLRQIQNPDAVGSGPKGRLATWSEKDFLQNLPRLTTHVEHIGQLRQTMLDLAVRGRLVSQDTGEEPVSELLDRISAMKASLIKEGKIKRQKEVGAIEPDTAPFTIPDSWNWSRLGDLTELITKGSSPKWQGVDYVSEDEGILFITSENVGNYHLQKLDRLKYVEKRFNEIEPRSVLQEGDILMNLVGASIGRTAIFDRSDVANINQAVALIRLVHGVPNLALEYILHYLNSPTSIQIMLTSQVVTAQPNISLTNAREFPIPVPPLAEQHRIVAKVNGLMALCDQLEDQLTTSQADSTALLEAVLDEAI